MPDKPNTDVEEQAPPKDEDELAQYVNRLFDSARDAMRPYVSKWQKYDKIYRGKHWPTALEPWRAQITNNICFSNIDICLAIAVDVDARMTALPVEGGDRLTADCLDELLKYGIYKHNLSDRFELGFLTKMKFGTTIYKAGWDADCGIEGDAVISRVLPFNFIPDPGAKTMDECRYVFECKILTLAEIKRLHPEKGKYVKADAGLKQKNATDDPSEKVELPEYNKDDDRFDNSLESVRKPGEDEFARALYVELWMRDDTTETVTEDEEEVQETTAEDGSTTFELVTVKNKVEKLKYPGGRRICFCGNVILEDGPNPYAHQQFPYAEEYNYLDDMSFWGMGEIENLESLQKEFDKRKSQIADNANLMGNPTWILDANSGVRPSSVSNAPGKAIRKTPGSEVRRDSPPELPRYVLDSYEATRRDIQDVSGIHEALQGRFGQGMDNYSAMRQAVDQAEMRPRKKIRHQMSALRRLGRLMLALYMQYYPEERWRRILGDEKVDAMLASRGQTELEFPLEEIYEMYDVFCETEIMTRNTRDLYRERMKELFGMQAVDIPALLEAFQVENRDKILARMGLSEEPSPPALSVPPSELPAQSQAALPPTMGMMPESNVNMPPTNVGGEMPL